MVNYVRQRPLKSRLFAKLCKSMESAHVSLILHTEVRWLSRGNVLLRIYELREELLIFFIQENLIEFSDSLRDELWCSKLAYLADIFQQLNKVNTNMQRRTENGTEFYRQTSFTPKETWDMEKMCFRWKSRDVSSGF